MENLKEINSNNRVTINISSDDKLFVNTEEWLNYKIVKEEKEEKFNLKVFDKGFVRLVDNMGTDSSVVQAARVSYGKGTKKGSSDKSLIRYLMRNRHTSPFEMCVIKLHIKCPIFVERQFVRHRTQSMNQISLRYSESTDDFYVPDKNVIKSQSTVNKQGRGEDLSEELKKKIYSEIEYEQIQDFADYELKLGYGLSRELARINLPVSLYTEFYTQMNLHNMFHFLKLRLDKHAQYEIRVYATAIYDILKELYPVCVEAFEDYVLNSKTFSAQELEIIQKYMPQDIDLTDVLLSEREKEEFLEKIKLEI